MISGIMTRLLADAPLDALVGNKIYPVVAEQDVRRPYVTVRRTGVAPTIVKNQVSDKDEVVFNVTAYDDTYKKCIDILAAVRTSLDGFTGTSNGINFLNVWYTLSEDLFDKEDNTYIVVDTYVARIER